MKTVQKVIAAHGSTSTEQVVKKMFPLKVLNILKGVLLEVRDGSCGWTKSLPRHKSTWW